MSVYTFNDFNLISSGQDLSPSKSIYTGAQINELQYNTNGNVPRIIVEGNGIDRKFKLKFPEGLY